MTVRGKTQRSIAKQQQKQQQQKKKMPLVDKVVIGVLVLICAVAIGIVGWMMYYESLSVEDKIETSNFAPGSTIVPTYTSSEYLMEAIKQLADNTGIDRFDPGAIIMNYTMIDGVEENERVPQEGVVAVMYPGNLTSYIDNIHTNGQFCKERATIFTDGHIRVEYTVSISESNLMKFCENHTIKTMIVYPVRVQLKDGNVAVTWKLERWPVETSFFVY
jgi:hypothetical protein